MPDGSARAHELGCGRRCDHARSGRWVVRVEGDLLGAEPGPESLPVAADNCNEQDLCWHGADGNYSPATAQCLLYDKLKT